MQDGITLKIDTGALETAIQNKVESLIDDSLMLEVHRLFAETIDPYVPYITGDLANTLEITPEYVRYLMPYARRVYDTMDVPHNTLVHPLASSQWDVVAMQTELGNFEFQVKELLKQRAKDLYG